MTARTPRSGGYEIRIGGVERRQRRGAVRHLLAIGDSPEVLPGRRTTEPVFGLPAVWVPPEHRATAEAVGATLVERAAVVTTHLAEMVRRHASRLLSLDDVKQLLDVLKAERPTAVEEVVPALLPLSGVQRVLQGLLDEQVSIRDLGRVLEGIGQRARVDDRPRRAARGRPRLPSVPRSPRPSSGTASCTPSPSTRRSRASSRRGCARASRASSSPSTRCSRISWSASCPRGDGCREHGRDTRAARRRTAAPAAAAAAARHVPAAPRPRVRRDGGADLDRDRRTGEPWPRLCCSRVTTSRPSSRAHAPRAARTRASSVPRSCGTAASSASSRRRSSRWPWRSPTSSAPPPRRRTR